MKNKKRWLALGMALALGVQPLMSVSAAGQSGKWSNDNGVYYWVKEDGQKAVNEWIKENGKYYYLQSDGKMAANRWLLIDGSYYHFNKWGDMSTGWYKENGTYYYLGKWGNMATGWKLVDGKYYYLKSWGGMATGWVKDGGKYYYMNQWGQMVTGWIKLGSNWYYLRGDGSCVMNQTCTIGGKSYTFDKNGCWVQKKAVSVKFEKKDTLQKEYAVIAGLDSSGNTVWTYTTEKYDRTELDRVCEIGKNGGAYYLVEGGSVVALNVADGTVLWKNKDFSGAGAKAAFGKNGEIYLCGYYGPDFFAVSSSGKTLKKITEFSSKYYWAYKIAVSGNQAVVTMAADENGDGANVKIAVNLTDFSYKRI